MSRKGIFSRKGETSVESMKVSLVTEEATVCVCVVCCKEETLGKRECVVYEEGESEREGEGEAHEEEAEDGRERERACTSGGGGVIWEVICVQSMTGY